VVKPVEKTNKSVCGKKGGKAPVGATAVQTKSEMSSKCLELAKSPIKRRGKSREKKKEIQRAKGSTRKCPGGGRPLCYEVGNAVSRKEKSREKREGKLGGVRY